MFIKDNLNIFVSFYENFIKIKLVILITAYFIFIDKAYIKNKIIKILKNLNKCITNHPQLTK